jgi:hypothetical protein
MKDIFECRKRNKRYETRREDIAVEKIREEPNEKV